MSEPIADSLSLLNEELRLVEQEVRAAVDDLQAPFSHLVQSQLHDNFPLLCGAFVLTSGVGAVDTPVLVQKRIYLGAAIEVLRLALAIHTRLLPAGETTAPLDRSLLGSTVLAGDFCFSRSAGLAAKTDSPAVVDIFAQALQRVSEGILRGLFGPDALFDVERDLGLCGVAAGNELASLAEDERQLDQRLAASLLDGWRSGQMNRLELPPALSPLRKLRWQVLADWLQSQ